MGQNPDFYVTPTSGVLELIFQARAAVTNAQEFRAQKDNSEAIKKAFLNFCAAGMTAYYRTLANKPYVLDKSRGWGCHFDLLKMIFHENPKIICMVRDIRAVLASMEKKYRETPERHKNTENPSGLIGVTSFKRALNHLNSPPVGLAIERLAEVFQRGWHEHFLFIKFEDLTNNPQLQLDRVYNYLNLPKFQHDFNNVGQLTEEDDEVFGIPGLHTIRPKVTPVENDFERIIGKDACNHVQKNYAWYFHQFGY